MRSLLLALTCLVAALSLAACGSGAAEANIPISPRVEPRVPPPAPGVRVQVPAPPFTEGVFPCSDCHNDTDLPSNPTRRQLVDDHDHIVLKHDEEHRWCLDCHDSKNRDQLHLAGGEAVPFEESYRLCGQCHGEKYRDWRAGVHGRRIGQWNGAKEYLLCVHCHSPHTPRFAPLQPKAAPLRPVPSGHGAAAGDIPRSVPWTKHPSR